MCIERTWALTWFYFLFFLLVSESSVRSGPVVCMQGMTTHFKTSKSLKVSARSVGSVSLDLTRIQDVLLFLTHCSCPAGQEGGGWEWPSTQRWRAGGHVRAGAQPAPAWADQGWRRAVEAAAADPEEPGLRCQLPHQTGHPEGGAGTPEDRPAAGGGQAGPGERQHEAGAGRPASQVRGPAVFRPDCDPRAPLAGQGGQHQRHHHRQVGQQAQQLQPDPVLHSVLVSTGRGSPRPAWSCPAPTPPGPTHPALRRRSVVRLRDGMGEASSMWCRSEIHRVLRLSSFRLIYTFYVVCALCNPPPP